MNQSRSLPSLRAQRSNPGAEVGINAAPGLLRYARNDGQEKPRTQKRAQATLQRFA